MGEAFNLAQQKQIFLDCLNILKTSEKPGIIVDSEYRWKISKF